MWRNCPTLLREFWSSAPGSDQTAEGCSKKDTTGRIQVQVALLVGCSMLWSGCGKSEAPVKQQAYQQVPRLSAEDENLIFGNATHVDIYEQLSIGPTESLETSEDPLPEKPTPSDADSFFSDLESEAGDQTPLFEAKAPSTGTPVLGEPGSIFGDQDPSSETPPTEKEPFSLPPEDPAELGSLEEEP